MLIVTTFDIPGREIIKTLGIVKGNTIRARHVGKDIIAALRGIVGGELHEYTKLLAESREQAIDRMIQDAERLGANAIVGLSFTTSVISQGAAELMAWYSCDNKRRKPRLDLGFPFLCLEIEEMNTSSNLKLISWLCFVYS